MAGFNGRWAVVSTENAEAYMTAAQIPDAIKAKLVGLMANVKTNPETFVEEVHVDKAGGTVHVKIFISGELKHDLKLEMGKEIDHTGMDGRQSKVMITLASDTKMVMTRKIGGLEIEIVYTLSTSGTEVTTTRTCAGVTCTDKFIKL